MRFIILLILTALFAGCVPVWELYAMEVTPIKQVHIIKCTEGTYAVEVLGSDNVWRVVDDCGPWEEAKFARDYIVKEITRQTFRRVYPEPLTPKVVVE